MVKQQRASSLKPFYLALGGIAVVGAGLIAATAIRSDANRPRAIDVGATPAEAEGYLLGNPNAPVQILEFADFECPHCAEFATVTEPDVRERIVKAGLASYRFFDFPLPHFRNSLPASNAAACADDQGKFWPMHDRLFQGQLEWNSEATSNPKKVFQRYAEELGLDTKAWAQCFDERRHLRRILGNQAEGERRHVNSTPTFVIGTKMIPGGLTYDQFKAYVDSAAAEAARHPAAPADSQREAGAAQ